ncbi:MAG: cyclic nucleotide-binding domain-containing protein [Rhodospirillales bacterium]
MFDVVIVGSGPGGLSAACHAATRQVSHLLLEKTNHLSDTIYKFQKGKPVMSTPTDLPVRADIPFGDGKREQVLAHWATAAETCGVNIQFNAQVTGITGQKGAFRIDIVGGAPIEAEHVVLACGLQGNLNKLRCDGADLPLVQYQLDDPDEYEHEHIVVIGGGDAAIENAVALAGHNTVYILNRSDEFARAKPPNEAAIKSLIDRGVIRPLFNADTAAIEPDAIIVEMPSGTQRVPCDRIIARIGAAPPRQFVENCGVTFPNDDRMALPEVSGHYESNVPGLYIIGALGGYPLIKQAVNQGYEVIEYMAGNTSLAPADQDKLNEKLSPIPDWSVDDFLANLRERIPIFNEMNPLMLRESLLEGTVHRMSKGDIVFERNDYTNSVFVIFEGAVRVHVSENPEEYPVLEQGAFFGELGLISGRRRGATVSAASDAILVEMPRRTMLKLRAAVPALKDTMNREAVVRQLQAHLLPNIDQNVVRELAQEAQVKKYAKGELLFAEGDDGDCMHLIMRGSVAIQKDTGGREVTLSYLPPGNYVGEMALISGEPRGASARAVVECKTICLFKDSFEKIVDQHPEIRRDLEWLYEKRSEETVRASSQQGQHDSVVEFLMDQGLGEGTDILLIDETLCVGCDNCTSACASTHGGVCHLDRNAGPSYANIHVPTSCRHCEHPHCMTECPPDAIRRAESGEVYIQDSCIGCGNCQRNCPYGVIQMAQPGSNDRGFLMSLLFGERPHVTSDDDRKRAVKCDMCINLPGGPACVRSCPTGAAHRVSPEDFMAIATKRGRLA